MTLLNHTVGWIIIGTGSLVLLFVFVITTRMQWEWNVRWLKRLLSPSHHD